MTIFLWVMLWRFQGCDDGMLRLWSVRRSLQLRREERDNRVSFMWVSWWIFLLWLLSSIGKGLPAICRANVGWNYWHRMALQSQNTIWSQNIKFLWSIHHFNAVEEIFIFFSWTNNIFWESCSCQLQKKKH